MKFILLATLTLFSPTVFGKYKLMSYNIRNFDYDQRSRVPTNKDHLFKILKEENADFIAVQEINQKEVFKSFIHKNFYEKYQTILSDCGGTHNQKLGFVYDKNKFKLLKFHEDLRTVNPSIHNTSHCDNGSRPLAIGLFEMQETKKKMVAISVHLKSGGRPKSIEKRFKQLTILSKVIQEYRSLGIEHFIVMGDFNSTEYIHRRSEFRKFKNNVQNMGLTDLAENLKCTSYWWGGIDDGKQYPSILDHILVSNSFAYEQGLMSARPSAHCKKLKCQTTFEYDLGVSFDEVSDHCPIIAN